MVKFKRQQPLFRIPCLISLGSGAGRVAGQINASAFDSYKIAVNNSERDLDQLGESVDECICVGNDRAGSGMDMEKGRQDFLQGSGELLSVVKAAIQKAEVTEPDIIPIICSAGHGFGGGSLPAALKLLRGEFPNSVILGWVITPFDFQGPDIRRRALDSIRACIENNTTVTPISNQVAARKLGLNQNKMSLSTLYGAINKELSSIMTSLFVAFTATEGVIESMDRNDLRRIYSGPATLISMVNYSSAASIGVETLQDAENHLLVDVSYGFNPKEKQPTVTYIVDGPGQLSVQQMSELSEAFMTTYKSDMSYFKPLIIQRQKKDTTFMLIRGNVQLDV